MRTMIAWTLTLVVGGWAARTTLAQTNPPTAKRSPAAEAPKAPIDPKAIKAQQEAVLKARAEMDTLLKEWEEQSTKITSLDVIFDRVDKAPAWGDEYYRGRAMLQSPDLACLEFKKYKLDKNGKPLAIPGKDGKPVAQFEPDPTERIVCTGTEVLQYTWDDRKIFVFPLDKKVRQKTLQQGPLPFLFNMKAADAKARYSMTLLNQDAKEYLIGITPNEEIDQQSFTKAFLWLNKGTFLPNQLWLFPVGQKERQEFRFTGGNNTIKPNTKMDPNFFAFTKIDGWKVILNPGQGGNAAAAKVGQAPVGAAPAKKQAAQPGTRPPAR